MKKELTELERLDIAARNARAQQLERYVRVALTCFTPFVSLLAVVSTASFGETLSVRIAAILLVLATVSFWAGWIYRWHFLSFLFVLFACVSPFFGPNSHRLLSWLSTLCYSVVYLYWGIASFVLGNRTALTNSPAWNADNTKVESWLAVLKGESSSEVIEFPYGSFWKGYFTYRLLNTGEFWAVAIFKRGTKRLCNYRVLPHTAVTTTDRQQVMIRMDKHTIFST